jgi:radical SAM protein with 4Fe4S-binding SPASM domain
MTTPYCTAPFHGFLVDPDKTVRPCCIWQGNSIGDLKHQNINDIRNSEKLKNIQEAMLKNEPPDNCRNCIEREKTAGGKSVRTDLYSEIDVPYLGNDKITYLEFNSSNLCNLVCVGCGPSWSTAWVEFRENVVWWKDFRKNYGWERYDFHETHVPSWEFHPPRPDFATNFFDTVDLSSLTKLLIKGGEPFLNKENILLLEYLEERDILKNVNLIVTTNGTHTSDRFLELMNKAKTATFWMSIDGYGELNQYIRHDPKHPQKSHTDEIKKNIIEYAKFENIRVSLAITVQAHNIFKLEDIRQFWMNEIHPINPNMIAKHMRFDHVLIHPRELSFNVFREATRFKLADYYESIDEHLAYTRIIPMLRGPGADKELHKKFINYTKAIDKTRLKSFIQLVPEAEMEMFYQ